MRALICGGRDFLNAALVWSWLDRLHEATPITAIIQGGAAGVDAIANEWAKTKPEIQRFVCRADWKKHGRSAGPKRNARMLEWRPDVVVAFPGGRGTADMLARAIAAKVKIIDLREMDSRETAQSGLPVPAPA